MFAKWFSGLAIRKRLLIACIVFFSLLLMITAAGAVTLVYIRDSYSNMVASAQADLTEGFAAIDPESVELREMARSVGETALAAQARTDALTERMLWFQIGITILAVLLAALIVLVVSSTISKPITRLVDVAHDVADGNLDVKFDATTLDEVGLLAESFERVVNTINTFVRDLRNIDRAFRIDGDTSVRLGLQNYSGAYAEVAAAINDVLEYHVVSKNELLKCISKIVGGEHNAPLRRFPGQESRINEAVDDIRISVRALEQVMRQKADAEAASQAKSTFLANMSHEIRTPMSAIVGVTELLMDSSNLPEGVEQGLVTIYNSSNLLREIINDILDFSKIEAGRLDITPEPYNVASMINDTTQLNMMRIDGRAIDFKLKINKNIPAHLIGDELRIKQILNNLLSNAFKYTNTGRVTLSVDFRQNGDDDPSDTITLILGVHDTGYGMTPEEVKGLFSEYTRFDQQHGRTIEGTGLGLAITKRLIDLMNGDIQVESEVGKGSVFTVWLPQKRAGSEVLGSDVAESLRKFKLNYISGRKMPHIVRSHMPYGKVLIVDDVEPNLYVAEGIMKLYRLQIDTAMSGREALEKLKAGNVYDVVFLDHMMPVMDGIETAKRIRALGYTQPIVALTANAVAGHSEAFLQNGFDDFISKPIDTRRLNSILNRLVRDKQPPEVLEAARLQAEEENQKINDMNAADQPRALTLIGRAMSDDIYGLDVEKGLAKFGGDEEAYVKTLRAYVGTIGSMLESIREVKNDDLKSYAITVHGIKGASYDIFANTAGLMAESLEKAAKGGEYDYVVMKNATFIYTVGKTIGNIKELLEQVDNETPKPVKDKPDDAALSKLLSACNARDMDGTDAAMDEIEQYTYKNDDGLARQLREYVNLVKFKQIAETLTQMGIK